MIVIYFCYILHFYETYILNEIVIIQQLIKVLAQSEDKTLLKDKNVELLDRCNRLQSIKKRTRHKSTQSFMSLTNSIKVSTENYPCSLKIFKMSARIMPHYLFYFILAIKLPAKLSNVFQVEDISAITFFYWFIVFHFVFNNLFFIFCCFYGLDYLHSDIISDDFSEQQELWEYWVSFNGPWKMEKWTKLLIYSVLSSSCARKKGIFNDWKRILVFLFVFCHFCAFIPLLFGQFFCCCLCVEE